MDECLLGASLSKCSSLVIFTYGVICKLPTLGIAWGGEMMRYYAPCRSLKPYREMDLEILAHGKQSATRGELGDVANPLKATVESGNYIGGLLGRWISSRRKSKT